MRVYLDACIVIYIVERHPEFFTQIDEYISRNQPDIVVSGLTRLECLVQPLRLDNMVRLRQFELFFNAPDLAVVPFSEHVFDRAAALRARHCLKTPDALHLAVAIEAGCDQFWTNDQRLDAAASGYLRVLTL